MSTIPEPPPATYPRNTGGGRGRRCATLRSMSGEPVHRVLLVEDDAPTRAHLARAIEANSQLSLVGAAANCHEARAMLAVEQPDVLVTDLGLGDGSGNSLIREVTRADPKTLAMVITVFGDERSLVEAIEAGATGYLLKSTPSSEIATAILELLRGGSPISAPIARYLLRRFKRPASPVGAEAEEVAASAGAAPPLTGREVEVLRLVAKGFQFSEIAELLEISAHTVTTHIRHIYRKLDVHSRGAAVHEAMSRGIIDI
jgi:DNA-binding NarL/FixJ family response regulator